MRRRSAAVCAPHGMRDIVLPISAIQIERLYTAKRRTAAGGDVEQEFRAWQMRRNEAREKSREKSWPILCTDFKDEEIALAKRRWLESNRVPYKYGIAEGTRSSHKIRRH